MNTNTGGGENKPTEYDCCKKCWVTSGDGIGKGFCQFSHCSCHASPQPEGEWEKTITLLAKEYANQHYLVSEENHPPTNERAALRALLDVVSSQIARAEERGREEERQFILNILDGVDIADAERGLPRNTKAIRFALQSRHIAPVSTQPKE